MSDDMTVFTYHSSLITSFKYLLKRFGKLVDAGLAANPARGDERPGGEALARARGVRERHRVGRRVEADAVRAGDVARARRGDGDFAAVGVSHDVAQAQRRARRRVALARVVRLLDERRVVEALEQLGGARDDAVEEVDADREVRAVDERAALALEGPAHFVQTRVPPRRPLDERDARQRTRLRVARHGVGDREVYDGVVAAEYLGQLLRAEGRLARPQNGRHLVARLARQTLDQLPHRSVTE